MSAQQIKVRRGTDAQRQGVTLAEGEPAFTTDTKQLFVGDGVAPGGVPIASTTETTLGPHGVEPFAQVRQADGNALTTNTSQTNSFHIKAGTNNAFVLAGPALSASGAANTSGVFKFALPPQYVAGGQVRVSIRHKLEQVSAGSFNSASNFAVTARRQTDGNAGGNLCTTNAANLNTSYVTTNFVLNTTGLVAGDVLVVGMQSYLHVNSGTYQLHLDSIKMLCDVKG